MEDLRSTEKICNQVQQLTHCGAKHLRAKKVALIWPKRDRSKMDQTLRDRRETDRPVNFWYCHLSCAMLNCWSVARPNSLIIQRILTFSTEEKPTPLKQHYELCIVLIYIYIYIYIMKLRFREVIQFYWGHRASDGENHKSNRSLLDPKYILYPLMRITPDSRSDIWTRRMTSGAHMWTVGLILGHLVEFHKGILLETCFIHQGGLPNC